MAAKFMALIGSFSLTVGLQLLVFINGWGLQVKSWGWVIGGGVIGMTIAHIIVSKVFKDVQ